ncbi:hypothetical protein AWY79_15965 [Pseudodesulfovibrio indicus]|uniref:Uncharacterized protein n=1 Tax=Pseudodesulfovibrio indicus TaxID=1716143 RepID=A0ABN4M3C3_9BACT|nr:hypothetical protein AWY79_15965 [Pseudodesulfovibrio indicus]
MSLRQPDLVPAHAGHHHVQQNQVGTLLPGRALQGRGPVRGREQGVEGLQRLDHDADVLGLVVHKEDGFGHSHAI